MLFSKLALLAGAVGVAAHVAPVAQSPTGSADAVDTASECRLPPALDPYRDGLPHSSRLWGGRNALSLQVKRLQAAIRVPSICYDDLGPIGDDERWEPFEDLQRVLWRQYPEIYQRARVERVNAYGLVYTIEGSDASLKPILLTAHQDVVPVEDESSWTHDPFEGFHDGQFVWGRGASGGKNSLTAIMSTLETMLGDTYWRPRRTVLVAVGFDEECSGYRGAGHIAEVLARRYGDDGLTVILGEGGLGIHEFVDAMYVLPSMAEKGNVNVWFELDVAGGQSSVPPAHSGIGIMSEIVSALESNPFKPRLTKESPVYAHMACMAHYSPDEKPEITELVRQGDAQGIAELLDGMGPAESFTVRTSQAVDFICGGQNIKALPEKITLGVNYRVTADDGISKVLHSIVGHVDPIVKKWNLTTHAFEDDDDDDYDDDYLEYAAKAESIRSKSDRVDAKYERERERERETGGRLVIKATDMFQPSKTSPMHGKVWDTFSGSAQHTLKFDGTVVPVGETMTGNTDARHYQNLSPNIYRFTPTTWATIKNVNMVDERADMRDHMNRMAFYYDFIRNFDRAELEGEGAVAVAEDSEEL